MSTLTSSKLRLEAIPRDRVYTAVAKQLQDLIVRKLHPGDMLPPERELVQMLGVSRSSVRDAIHSLELLGLLQARQGVGTVVQELSAGPAVGQFASLVLQKRTAIGELLDVRKVIEPPLAGRAAERATAADVANLEAVLERQERKLRQGKLPIDEDTAFHYGIAVAAKNSVLLKVVNILMGLLRETRARSLQVAGRQEKSLAGHRRLLEAVKRADAEAAEAAMRQHLSEIEEIILKKL